MPFHYKYTGYFTTTANGLKFSKTEWQVIITIGCRALSDDEINCHKLNEEVTYYLICVQDNEIGFN